MRERSHIDQSVQEQASAFYLDLQDGTMSALDFQTWQDWMEASDAHRRAFARLEALMGVLDTALPEDWAPLTEGMMTDAEVADVPEEAEDEPKDEAAGNTIKDTKTAGSVIGMISGATDAEEKVSFDRGHIWGGAIAASLALFLVMSFAFFSGDTGQSSPKLLEYQTAQTEQRTVHLTDGSIVELGHGTRLSVAFSADQRELTLHDGEAVFSVTKNPQRPFIVRAGTGSVTAIGTVFNVRKDAAGVAVRVLEGTVAVRPNGNKQGRASNRGAQQVALVTAGRETRYSQQMRELQVVEADVHRGLDWRVGVLTMVDQPLDSVIQQLNRYLTDEITIGDDAVASLRFTGTVYPDQVNAWLDGLQEGYPIEVVRLGGSTILMMAGETSNDPLVP